MRLFWTALLITSAALAAEPRSPARYAQLRDVVLTPACIRCHSDYVTEAGLATALVPGDPGHSPLYQSVVSGGMPKSLPALSSDQIRLIRDYIEHAEPRGVPAFDLNHVTYEALSARVFQPRCVSCHQKYSTEEGVLQDIEPHDTAHSILYNYVVGGKMPRDGYVYSGRRGTPQELRPLSADEIEAIRRYIERAPTKKMPPITPTWASLQKNLIQRTCVTCHSSGGPAGDTPLETREQVTAMSVKILARIQDPKKPMPGAHTTLPPSAAVVEAFRQWIRTGK